MKYLKTQLNLNSLLVSIVGGLVLYGVKRMDAANTLLIQLASEQRALVERVNHHDARLDNLEFYYAGRRQP